MENVSPTKTELNRGWSPWADGTHHFISHTQPKLADSHLNWIYSFNG